MAYTAALPYVFLALLGSAHASLNGHCSAGSNPGTCIATADCTSAGGTYAAGYCPNDPTDVKCCYKTSCDSGKGSCQWTSACSGTSHAGFCPGPTDFQCCEGSSTPTTSGNKASVASFADAHWNCAKAACTSKVVDGTLQGDYQCAKFVSRSLAARGYVPGLSAGDAQSSYGAYSYGGKRYNLNLVSSKEGKGVGLEDFLIASGWHTVSITSANVQAGAVVFMLNWGHVAIGVGSNLIDAHNRAHYHTSLSYWSNQDLKAIYIK